VEISYDTGSDAMFVWFRDRTSTTRTRVLDENRFIKIDDNGIVGMEFLEVSRGIDLEGVPNADEIRKALEAVIPA
jgi:uncharacterized protein YuzE